MKTRDSIFHSHSHPTGTELSQLTAFGFIATTEHMLCCLRDMFFDGGLCFMGPGSIITGDGLYTRLSLRHEFANIKLSNNEKVGS